MESRHSLICRLAMLAALAGCADAPTRDSGTVSFARGGPGGNPAVSSVDPSFGHQNERVNGIQIVGSGFDQSAVVRWERDGVADPNVAVLSTRFISSTQLEVDIQIAGDATLDLYDVAVMLAGGKRGVGIEAFEVTTAEYLGVDGYLYGISESGQVAGYGLGGGALTWEDGAGVTALGDGQAWDVDPASAMVLGRGPESRPTAWLRLGPGSYQTRLLPSWVGSTGGNATTAARTGSGELIIGGWDQASLGTKRNSGSVNRAAVWRLAGGTWSGPEIYATPPGLTGSSIRSINASAQAAGVANGQQVGVIWDDAATFTVLDGLANGINPAGTIAVGHRNGTPVYWWRHPVTQQWNAVGVPLPSLGGTCTDWNVGAQDINAAGIVVGTSCNAARKIQATVWQLEFSALAPTLVGSPVGLPGLGSKLTGSGTVISNPKAITEGTPYIVAGIVNYKGKTTWVRWRLTPP